MRAEPPRDVVDVLGGSDKAAGVLALVRAARAGEYGPEAADLARVLFVTATRAKSVDDRAERLEREANALAAVVADLLNGAEVNDVVDDLPHDARRRVMAYRHASLARAAAVFRVAKPQDQFGRLPEVPPRSAVMRDRRRVIDVDPNPQ